MEALVGQADGVDQTAGDLPQPRRRIALPGLDRDGLRDEGGEREALDECCPEYLVGGDCVERPGSVDDRVLELDAAERDRSMSGPCERGAFEL